jgi:hypothetical protein
VKRDWHPAGGHEHVLMRRQIGARQRLGREPLRLIELAIQRVHRVPAVRAGAQRPAIESVRSPRRRAITNTVTASRRGSAGGDPLNGE